MPAYKFTGLVGTVYPFTRDAQDQPVGAVEPGAVREFDAAPDWQWVAAGNGQQESPAAGEEMQAVEHPADGTWSPPVSNDPQPSVPQPAPPAVVPPAGPQTFAVTTGA